MPPPELSRPETPPRVRDKLVQGELLYHQLAEKVDGMAHRIKGLGDDVRDLSRRMTDHEKANADRAIAHAEAERALREEIGELRRETNRKLDGLDSRMDDLASSVRVLIDRQPAPETSPPHGPLGTALGLPPRRTGSTAAVAGGGVSLAAVLGILVQLGGLPVAVQWVLGVLAVMVGVTACVVVGVRMTRRE